MQKTKIAKAILKITTMKQNGGIKIPHFKTYCRVLNQKSLIVT